MLESFMRLPKSPPPANHRHVQQGDLPSSQIYTLDPVPRSRLAGCVLAVLLSGWMLAVPIALIDRLKDAPGPGTAVLTGGIIASALVTAGLGGFRFFNARDVRKRSSGALIAALAAAVTAAAASALLPEYGLLLAVPGLLAGVPALVALARDHRRHPAPGTRN
ncbi:peptidoglycan/LPS O-acetylase OafA/YrhL [Arthrobacter sp. SORGH_AS 212]|uniref:hypothetical protein n=1 Tax=Pseudarthrobacter TaxID=1742993 RepID=UPI002782559F|nr:hypothetical protein [Pseudarthrobacter equi]MDQ1053746.1 peptidoglycan/LPS O-acetylase OafA/YrhL [Arthrobacter sp. SORGH_AS_0212]